MERQKEIERENPPGTYILWQCKRKDLEASGFLGQTGLKFLLFKLGSGKTEGK